MDFKLFEKSTLALVNKNRKFSLFHVYVENNEVKFLPIEPLTDVSDIFVAEEAGLVFSTKGLYNIEGQKVSDFALTQVELIHLAGECYYLIVSKVSSSSFDVLLWNGKNIVWSRKVTDYKTSERFVALQEEDSWVIYRYNGNMISLTYQISKNDKLFLGNSLVVCGTPGNYRMYSLYDKSLLCSDKNLIVASPTEHFALCAKLFGKKVNSFYNGCWTTFDNVDNFCIVDNDFRLFALSRNDKYFIYNFDGTIETNLAERYPNGVDFIASDNGVLLIMNDNDINFYEKKR